jgi:hypothetical protein
MTYHTQKIVDGKFKYYLQLPNGEQIDKTDEYVEKYPHEPQKYMREHYLIGKRFRFFDNGEFAIKWVHRPYDKSSEGTYYYPIKMTPEEIADEQDQSVGLITALMALYPCWIDNLENVDLIPLSEVPPDSEKRNILEDLARAEHQLTFKL